MQADLIGISLAVAPGKACYIPLQHRAGEIFKTRAACLATISKLPAAE